MSTDPHSMVLVHYPRDYIRGKTQPPEPFITLDREYLDHCRTEYMKKSAKPAGFWVSVHGEDDWASWCIENEFGTESLATAYRVTLSADASILYLDSAEAVQTFHDTYSVDHDFAKESPYADLWTSYNIDWPRAAREYQGIIIAPYQWCHRMSLQWYYGWDCASGCIWDHRAIESVVRDTTLDVHDVAPSWADASDEHQHWDVSIGSPE